MSAVRRLHLISDHRESATAHGEQRHDDRGFDQMLWRHRLPSLARGAVTTLQVNVGKRCNMACHHCHVDAGPKRTEVMSPLTAARIIELLDANADVMTLDLTGGAPELNPSFRFFVTEARKRGKTVIDRCNLTILFEPGMEDLPEFLAAHEVRVVASLPCYQRDNVERQRGKGAFDRSIAGLQRLNALGYGRGGALELDLVYNPIGPSLPPAQEKLETAYRDELGRFFGIDFNRLLTITNMPIQRFAHALERDGRLAEYMSLLVNHFNPATVEGLMCRSLVSVGWDGRLFDCDFNQMLDLDLGASNDPLTAWDITNFTELRGARVATAGHCFGCTAGVGSSCSGALDLPQPGNAS